MPAARHISGTREDGDLVITVCDLAREELGGLAAVHWSVPDPVPSGDPGSFDAALDDLGWLVGQFAPRMAEIPSPRRLGRTGGCRGRPDEHGTRCGDRSQDGRTWPGIASR